MEEKKCTANKEQIPYGWLSNFGFRINGLFRCRKIFEIGCGNGISTDTMIIWPEFYEGVDPSPENINSFKAKYPDYSKLIQCMPFDMAMDSWMNSDSLLIATFGIASYLSISNLNLIENKGNDYILMFFQEKCTPEPYVGQEAYKYSLSELSNIFLSAQILPVYDFYIVSNLELHKYEIDRLIDWEISHLDLLVTPNSFRPNIPFNNLFTRQMSLIMELDDDLLQLYEPYINYKELKIDYSVVIDKYINYNQKCKQILPFTDGYYEEDFNYIINRVEDRIELFRRYSDKISI